MSSATILIVAAPYYRDIADQLIAGASGIIYASGHQAEMIEVPGALEIPPAIAIAAQTGRYHAYVALGCVIRGETSHYDIVAGESARGLMELAVHGPLPIGNGILTCESMEQATARATVTLGNKGAEAAQAALRLMELQQGVRLQMSLPL
jgi:6,7-dimethyl-8-ribityllumazine synthase